MPMMQKGSTNGFRFTDSLVGSPNRMGAVVPMPGGTYYAMIWPGVARNVAVSQGAFGFWRRKKGT